MNACQPLRLRRMPTSLRTRAMVEYPSRAKCYTRLIVRSLFQAQDHFGVIKHVDEFFEDEQCERWTAGREVFEPERARVDDRVQSTQVDRRVRRIAVRCSVACRGRDRRRYGPYDPSRKEDASHEGSSASSGSRTALEGRVPAPAIAMEMKTIEGR